MTALSLSMTLGDGTAAPNTSAHANCAPVGMIILWLYVKTSSLVSGLYYPGRSEHGCLRDMWAPYLYKRRRPKAGLQSREFCELM